MRILVKAGMCISLMGLMIGCATHLTKPTKENAPTKVRFGTFNDVLMKTVAISEAFSSSEANQKARNKIDQILFENMRMVFPDLKRVDSGTDFSKSSKKTLWITPLIQEVKFIGGGARFWVGAMAGSSAVLMQVTFQDSSNGEIVADPQFYRAAGAWGGGWTVGGTDNAMLETVAKDIVSYTTLNK